MTSTVTNVIAIAALFTLAGCKCSDWQPDQKLRHNIFQKCLETVKDQPDHNHEDNNGHIVDECSSAAYSQSLRDTGECQ